MGLLSVPSSPASTVSGSESESLMGSPPPGAGGDYYDDDDGNEDKPLCPRSNDDMPPIKRPAPRQGLLRRTIQRIIRIIYPEDKDMEGSKRSISQPAEPDRPDGFQEAYDPMIRTTRKVL